MSLEVSFEFTCQLDNHLVVLLKGSKHSIILLVKFFMAVVVIKERIKQHWTTTLCHSFVLTYQSVLVIKTICFLIQTLPSWQIKIPKVSSKWIPLTQFKVTFVEKGGEKKCETIRCIRTRFWKPLNWESFDY